MIRNERENIISAPKYMHASPSNVWNPCAQKPTSEFTNVCLPFCLPHQHNAWKRVVPLSWGWSMYKDHEDDEFKACHKPRTCNIGLVALPSILSSAAPSVDLATSLRAGKSSHWAEISVARAEYLKVRRTCSIPSSKTNVNMSRGTTAGKRNNSGRTRRLKMLS